jgi:DNA-binding response OmpR family regulator
MRLLVVEDELRMASAICRSLTREGLATEVAADTDQQLRATLSVWLWSRRSGFESPRSP